MSWNIQIDASIKTTLPDTRLGILTSGVTSGSSSGELQQALKQAAGDWQDLSFTDIRNNTVITDTRQAYKVLGADPNRYRPAAEALLRRIIKKKKLYHINAIVDTINWLVVKTAYSIGGFDTAGINGEIRFVKAPSGITYEAIGRGNLNITNLPALKDSNGYFGTPTSDSLKTAINENTTEILLVFYAFYQNPELPKALELASDLIKKYANAVHPEIEIIPD